MIIVTGGAGFIGSNIVRGLNNLGIDDIIIIDDLKNGSKHKNLNRIKFKDYIDKEDSIDFIERECLSDFLQSPLQAVQSARCLFWRHVP